jgi:hypothetical protein
MSGEGKPMFLSDRGFKHGKTEFLGNKVLHFPISMDHLINVVKEIMPQSKFTFDYNPQKHIVTMETADHFTVNAGFGKRSKGASHLICKELQPMHLADFANKKEGIILIVFVDEDVDESSSTLFNSEKPQFSDSVSFALNSLATEEAVGFETGLPTTLNKSGIYIDGASIADIKQNAYNFWKNVYSTSSSIPGDTVTTDGLKKALLEELPKYVSHTTNLPPNTISSPATSSSTLLSSSSQLVYELMAEPRGSESSTEHQLCVRLRNTENQMLFRSLAWVKNIFLKYDLDIQLQKDCTGKDDKVEAGTWCSLSKLLPAQDAFGVYPLSGPVKSMGIKCKYFYQPTNTEFEVINSD